MKSDAIRCNQIFCIFPDDDGSSTYSTKSSDITWRVWQEDPFQLWPTNACFFLNGSSTWNWMLDSRSQADSLVTRAHDAIDRFKPRQQAIYLKVQHLWESHNTLCFFIDGKAGCGKTTLINTICDILQSQGKIVLAIATSTFAAQLYAGGRTTDSTFKVIDIISSKSHSPF